MIAGIDYSTHAADIVLLDEDLDAATWHRFELVGQDAFERARCVRQSMPGPHATFWDGVLAVGIEDPRGYNAGSLYRVQGAILGCLPHGLLVQPWIPSAWRKAVGLSGRATKEEVAYHACGLLGDAQFAHVSAWPQDAWDAYLVALATRSLIQVEDAA